MGPADELTFDEAAAIAAMTADELIEFVSLKPVRYRRPEPLSVQVANQLDVQRLKRAIAKAGLDEKAVFDDATDRMMNDLLRKISDEDLNRDLHLLFHRTLEYADHAVRRRYTAPCGVRRPLRSRNRDRRTLGRRARHVARATSSSDPGDDSDPSSEPPPLARPCRACPRSRAPPSR